jgi:hypothetical protein
MTRVFTFPFRWLRSRNERKTFEASLSADDRTQYESFRARGNPWDHYEGYRQALKEGRKPMGITIRGHGL